MESIATADLLELVMMLRDDAQTQFEYWLNVTFAIIAASFVGQNHLTTAVKAVVGSLYLLTSWLLVLRYGDAAVVAGKYILAAEERGVEFLPGDTITTNIRLSIFLLGTLSAIWFLYRSGKPSVIDT